MAICISSTTPISRPKRHVARHLALQRGKVDVQHHHDEQEQHRHRADVDDDQQHRHELGPQQHEQARGRQEGQDQPQHRMHRVAADGDHQARRDRHDGEDVEGKIGDGHASFSLGVSAKTALGDFQRLLHGGHAAEHATSARSLPRSRASWPRRPAPFLIVSRNCGSPMRRQARSARRWSPETGSWHPALRG